MIWPESVTAATFNFTGSTVLAGAIEVVDTFEYGMAFSLPVGENEDSRGGNSIFEDIRVFITAAEDDTQVFLNGALQGTIGEGETIVINPAILNAGDDITSSKDVQAHLLTGDTNGDFETRWYSLTPNEDLGNDYYSPATVKTGAGDARQIEYFVHNPGISDITVNWQGTGGASGSFTVLAGDTVLVNTSALPDGVGGTLPLPTDSAIRFFTNDVNEVFSVISALDVPAGDPDGRDYDWGFTVQDTNNLSSRFVVGFAPGSANPDGSIANQNGSPIWVTAIADTTITVDWDGDLDTSGDQQSFNVSALEALQLFDPADNDQSGALVFTTDGTLIAGAYGEDASNSEIADPFLDLGYTIRALPTLDIEKATNGEDADVPTGPIIAVGDLATFTYKVSNIGGSAIFDVVVTDDNGTPEDTSDDFNPTFTGGDDDNDGQLDPGEIWMYEASRIVTPGQYTNNATVTGNNSVGEPVAPDADPSNHFGVDLAVDIEKSTNGEDADTPTGPIVTVGDIVTWEYLVTNNSNVDIDGSNVEVTDDQGVIPVFDPASDDGGDNILSIGETWRYSAQGLAQEGQYANNGKAKITFSPTGQMAMDSDPSHYFGECPPCEFDVFDAFSGSDINVTITLEEIEGGVKFTVTVTDLILTGDLRGVFFHVEPDGDDVLTGLTVTGADVTDLEVERDSVQDLGSDVNMKGDGNKHKYDVGVEIGTQGMSKDDIQSTMFIVSSPGVELNLDNFADVEFGVRLTSVGVEGRNREQSSKIFGYSPEDCGCNPLPNGDILPSLTENGIFSSSSF